MSKNFPLIAKKKNIKEITQQNNWKVNTSFCIWPSGTRAQFQTIFIIQKISNINHLF